MTPQPTPHPSTDPTLAVAERQLGLLGELAEIAMAAARAFGASALAAAGAEKTILGEEWFTPEVGRARACGAKDAAESLQKVSRAVRLTLKLEMAVAEIVRDIRAGIVTHTADTERKDAGETPAVQDELPDRRRLAGSCSADRDSDWTRLDTNTERLVEFDRLETLPRAPFRDIVEPICADLGVTVDWKAWKVRPPKIDLSPGAGLVRTETAASRFPPTPLAALKATSRPPHSMGREETSAISPSLPRSGEGDSRATASERGGGKAGCDSYEENAP